MDNITHNSSSSSSWDLDMTLGSHHHLLFDHPTPSLTFDLAHHHHHPHPHGHPLDPSSLFQPHLGLPPHPLDASQRLTSSTHHHGSHGHGHHDQEAEELEEEERHHHEQGEGGPEEEEVLGAMKEMMYRIAAMQPVDIDPATIKKPRRRNVRISDDPQSVAARHRRERISERIRILQRLVPGGTKMDTASMLDEAIRYIKFLKRQVQELQQAPPAPGAPGPSSSSVLPPPPRAGGSFIPLGPGPVINWTAVRPTDIHGPTSSSSSSSMGAHTGLGFGFSSGGQSSHGMH